MTVAKSIADIEACTSECRLWVQTCRWRETSERLLSVSDRQIEMQYARRWPFPDRHQHKLTDLSIRGTALPADRLTPRSEEIKFPDGLC